MFNWSGILCHQTLNPKPHTSIKSKEVAVTADGTAVASAPKSWSETARETEDDLT